MHNPVDRAGRQKRSGGEEGGADHAGKDTWLADQRRELRFPKDTEKGHRQFPDPAAPDGRVHFRHRHKPLPGAAGRDHAQHDGEERPDRAVSAGGCGARGQEPHAVLVRGGLLRASLGAGCGAEHQYLRCAEQFLPGLRFRGWRIPLLPGGEYADRFLRPDHLRRA